MACPPICAFCDVAYRVKSEMFNDSVAPSLVPHNRPPFCSENE